MILPFPDELHFVYRFDPRDFDQGKRKRVVASFLKAALRGYHLRLDRWGDNDGVALPLVPADILAAIEEAVGREKGGTDVRRCPFPGCTRVIPSNFFACKPHWWGTPKELRDEADRLARAAKRGEISIAALRRRQGEIVAEVMGKKELDDAQAE